MYPHQTNARIESGCDDSGRIMTACAPQEARRDCRVVDGVLMHLREERECQSKVFSEHDLQLSLSKVILSVVTPTT